MFQEPEHFTNSDHFFFEFNDELASVCNAPKDKQGVFKILELRKGEIKLVFIGHSGSDGLFDAIVLGHHRNGKSRSTSLSAQLLKDETDALDIYWYEINQKANPEIIATEMLQDYKISANKLPKWN